MPFLTDMYHEQNRRRDGRADGAPVAIADGRPPPGTFDASAVAERLRARVIGQDRAVAAVLRGLVLARAGVNDPDRPLANLLLVGPTGVGKTELVRRVAAELRSGPDDLCRVDMNSLAQEHYAASFSGAPPGYAGSKEAFTLFDPTTVEGDPYTPGIVLFDEVEKAHPTVLRALLQVLDSGTLRLASGQRTISFRNSFVFLTSNLGSTELARRAGSRWRRIRYRDDESVVRGALRDFFDPEFLNRIDETVVFGSLDRAACARIAALEAALLVKRLSRRRVELSVDESAIRLLAERGFDPVYGARGLRRVVRELLATPVAELLTRPGERPTRLGATARDGRITVGEWAID
ncbi:AAA family ATPase [Pseudonocardia eucalypti]|uniref:AAA family ATPase n=1 Tax=Pseudonocardia eucalypti TaxID=648755 RepID=A0ABP9QWV9_9PSEU|nr:ATP-dependent Clp protease ATP-binding subunit ClpA [Pseudonocardia eucalypti]